MNTIQLKSTLVKLVENTQNELVLQAVLAFFKEAVSKKEGACLAPTFRGRTAGSFGILFGI